MGSTVENEENLEFGEVRVLSVIPLVGMRLKLSFNDGTTRIFDVARWLDKIPSLKPLTDKKLFNLAKPICAGRVVSWRWDLDLSAEFVDSESEIVQSADQ